MNLKSTLETATNVGVLVACIVAIGFMAPQLKERWSGAQTLSGSRPSVEQVNGIRLKMPTGTVKGNERAPVALVEFSDFQCPFCGQYARDIASDLEREFVDSGKILYGFRNFPLTGLHPFALKAGQAAVCANDQYKFWSMHDILFRNQSTLDVASLRGYASKLDLDRDKFESCLEQESNARLAEDIDQARKAGVNSTPTFLLGVVEPDGTLRADRIIRGVQELSVFRDAIQQTLRSTRNPRRS